MLDLFIIDSRTDRKKKCNCEKPASYIELHEIICQIKVHNVTHMSGHLSTPSLLMVDWLNGMATSVKTSLAFSELPYLIEI